MRQKEATGVIEYLMYARHYAGLFTDAISLNLDEK